MGAKRRRIEAGVKAKVAKLFGIGRERAGRLMRLMGLEAVYPKPRLSQGMAGHRIYPYLLRKTKIERPNQVWASDITYVPMPQGWMYLTVVMDWHSRYVLSWRLSNTLDGLFCLEALEEALACGRPEIFNTDQGVQYTAEAFTGRLEAAGVRVSMDGRGRWMDNVFVERLWRTVKHEYLYLHEHATPRALQAGLAGRSLVDSWLCYWRFTNEGETAASSSAGGMDRCARERGTDCSRICQAQRSGGLRQQTCESPSVPEDRDWQVSDRPEQPEVFWCDTRRPW